MGVKELWSLVSPTGELLSLSALEGQAVAVDLSCWVVDSQSLHLGNVTRPHLRNLFFRTLALLNAGVLPVFVLEGVAPSLKWNTITSRNQRNFHHKGASKKVSVKTGQRSRFKSMLKECGELLDLLGIPWVQAGGEAEATCAALSYHQMVKGVITQDSDVFLYGGQTVFRNFTGNQQKATVERFSMEILEDRLQLTRGGLIVLGILLGCDYLPSGVQGVGKETAVKLLKAWYESGERDPVRRMCSWSTQDNTASQHTQMSSRKWKNGSIEELEAGVRNRVVTTEGFPFTEIIQEFQQKLSRPISKIQWNQPCYEELVKWCIQKLDWTAEYAVEKTSPVVTRWIVTHGTMLRCLQPVGIMRRCVRRGVVAYELQWKVITCDLPEDTPDYLITDEPLYLIQKSLPQLLHEFEEKANSKKRGKNKKKPKDDDKILVDDYHVKLAQDNTKKPDKHYKDESKTLLVKDDLRKLAENNSIQLGKNDLSKLVKTSPIKVIKSKTPKIVTSSVSPMYKNSKLNEYIMFSQNKEQATIFGEPTSKCDYTEGALNQTLKDDDEHEDDLSFIIDRIINIKVNNSSNHRRIHQKGMPQMGIHQTDMQSGSEKCQKNQAPVYYTENQRAVIKAEDHYTTYDLDKENVNLKKINCQKLLDSTVGNLPQEVIGCEDDNESCPESFLNRVSKRLHKLNQGNKKGPASLQHQHQSSNKQHGSPYSDHKSVDSWGKSSCKEVQNTRNVSSHSFNDDTEALACNKNALCEFKQSSEMFVQMEILCENNKSYLEIFPKSPADFCSPKSKADININQVSKDLFDDTDDSLCIVSCCSSSLPRLQSTPYLSDNGGTVGMSNSAMILQDVKFTPNAHVIENADDKCSCLSFVSPLQDNCNKLLFDKCLSYSATTSKLSDLSLNDSLPILNKQTIPYIVKDNNNSAALINCNSSTFNKTPKTCKERNLSRVTFRLLDSFSDCENSVSNYSELKPPQSSVTCAKELQKPSGMNIISCENREKNINLCGQRNKNKSLAIPIMDKGNKHGCNNDKPEIEYKAMNGVLTCDSQETNDASPCLVGKDKTKVCDPFSPFVGLTLAERLKKKYPSKTFVKFLDNV
nr:flap endonuclease GEN homolog 1-like [Procambarus clarkii]